MSDQNQVNRRSFLKTATGGSAAILSGCFSAGELLAQEKEFEIPNNRRSQASKGIDNPYQIDPKVLNRFDESEVAINVTPREVGMDNRTTSTGRDNVGLLSYNRLSVPEEIANIPPDLDDPKQLATQAKTIAKLAGADLVGICKLDRRWIYSHSQRNSESPDPPIKKTIEFEKVEKPYETDQKLVIPDRVNNVIVMAMEQNRVLTQCSPSMTTTCASSLGYSRMAIAVVMLAEYIRGMGYTAIPAMNGTGLSIPMAIDAGIGTCGRNGLLVSPEFGPNIRLCKVLTDMPLSPDKPIEFGVEEFCKTCKKCAIHCPSNALSHGERAWSGHRHNNPGTYKWYNDPVVSG